MAAGSVGQSVGSENVMKNYAAAIAINIALINLDEQMSSFCKHTQQ
jgi:hypothetical protein